MDFEFVCLFIIQASVGTAQSWILAVTACAATAKTRFRFALPPFFDVVNWAKMLHKMSRPIYGHVLLLAACHGAFAGLLTHRQQQQAAKVHAKLMTMEHKR